MISFFSWNNYQSQIINTSLASFARSVWQVMDPRFFLPCFHGPRALHLGHKRKGKNLVHNLPYGPHTRLVRGILVYFHLKFVSCLVIGLQNRSFVLHFVICWPLICTMLFFSYNKTNELIHCKKCVNVKYELLIELYCIVGIQITFQIIFKTYYIYYNIYIINIKTIKYIFLQS